MNAFTTLLGCAAVLTLPFAAPAQTPVKIFVRGEGTLPAISPEFEGLSYETATLLPDATGKHYFHGKNISLIHIFQTMGIKSLRIGGATVDDKRFAVPSHSDIDDLFAFARAAGVRVIYSFRLKDGDLAQALEQSKYITGHYSANLACFAIGNEPNEYLPQLRRLYPGLDVFLQADQRAKPRGEILRAERMEGRMGARVQPRSRLEGEAGFRRPA